MKPISTAFQVTPEVDLMSSEVLKELNRAVLLSKHKEVNAKTQKLKLRVLVPAASFGLAIA
jgi:hypothetical protein